MTTNAPCSNTSFDPASMATPNPSARKPAAAAAAAAAGCCMAMQLDGVEFINTSACAVDADIDIAYTAPALGVGVSGGVYHGVVRTTGALVAVKFLAAATPAQAARAHNEIACHRACGHHPNIVKILGVYAAAHNVLVLPGKPGPAQPYVVLVTEQLGGGELFYRIRDGPRLTASQLQHILAQLAAACDHMHQRGIMHGDLKLENILLTWPSSWAPLELIAVKIVDFGFGSTARHTITGNYTPSYITPELLQCEAFRRLQRLAPALRALPVSALGPAIDCPADMWAVGVVLYFMLECKAPFVSAAPGVLYMRGVPVDMRACILAGRFTPLSQLHPAPAESHMQISFSDLVAHLLCKMPAERLTASELLIALGANVHAETSDNVKAYC